MEALHCSWDRKRALERTLRCTRHVNIKPATQLGLAFISPIRKFPPRPQNLHSSFSPFFFFSYNDAPNRQCNSTSSATELGFLSGSTAVPFLLNSCDFGGAEMNTLEGSIKNWLSILPCCLGGVRGTEQIGITVGMKSMNGRGWGFAEGRIVLVYKGCGALGSCFNS